MSKKKQDTPTIRDRETMKQLIALFEQLYKDRLIYKAIAERDPGCSVLVQALQADRGIGDRITRTFTPIYECFELNQTLMKLLEALPSTGRNHNGLATEVAPSG